MQANSPEVTTNQQGCHEQLETVVLKHLEKPFLKPYSQFNTEAFQQAADFIAGYPEMPLIFDSGCGVGESTARLAELFPDHLVLGIDQSAHRTNKHHAYQGKHENYRIIRAELGDFWRLAIDHQWKLAKHYILYPNPWPKRYHLQKRWHGSPLFPAILALGGELELRSNWKTYLDEFAIALQTAGFKSHIDAYQPGEVQTPHERKYFSSGHQLWQLNAELGPEPGKH